MIRTQRTRLLMLAGMALLTTLLALIGIGKSSAGAVARNIECSHKLAHHLNLAESLKLQRSSPPPSPNKLFSPNFLPARQA
ncbi:hypothetical protein ACJRW5_08205 [Pseudomonas sp. SH1-B]